MTVPSSLRRGLMVVVGTAALALAAACGGDDDAVTITADTPTPIPVIGSPSPLIISTPSLPEVRVADVGGRRILTDSGGFTLYTFNEDNPGDGTSACNGACRQAWPEFIIETGPVVAPPDVTGEFSTIRRIDGGMQVTYNGKPLYRFQRDAAPGELNGDAFGDVWFAAEP